MRWYNEGYKKKSTSKDELYPIINHYVYNDQTEIYELSMKSMVKSIENPKTLKSIYNYLEFVT